MACEELLPEYYFQTILFQSPVFHNKQKYFKYSLSLSLLLMGLIKIRQKILLNYIQYEIDGIKIL